MAEFFSMGGYAGYVWPAYAVFVLVLAIDALAPGFARRRLLNELRGRLRRRAARENAGAAP